MTQNNQTILQIKKVIQLAENKKRKQNHAFLNTLLNKLHTLKYDLELGKGSQQSINGALRAYFDTNLVESYEEPLVMELDRLESMLKKA
ncbi:hypothetical protein [Sutcliffiella horikoshii]|uniref:hypothetical protein n=1 Tax=Sutcliffiella horikoshii TaxID=79883 RepID=UPI00384D9628